MYLTLTYAVSAKVRSVQFLEKNVPLRVDVENVGCTSDEFHVLGVKPQYLSDALP